MQSAVCRADCKSFIVLPAFDSKFRSRLKVQSIQKFQKISVFFVDADDLGALVGLQIGKQDRAVSAELRESAAQGNAMRAGFFASETFKQKRFDFWGNGMFQTLRFVVRLGPRQTNYIGEQHLSELMA